MRTFPSACAAAAGSAKTATQKTARKWMNRFIDGPHTPAVRLHRVILLTLTGGHALEFEENALRRAATK
jgi:hypothetical protein